MSVERVTAEDRVRVAAYAVVRDEHDRVLLCHIHPSVGVGDVWTLPGGGLDFGEPPAQAALRELEEETGFRGEIERLLDVDDRLFTSADGRGRMHAIRIVYAVRVVGGSLRDETDGSTDTCGWIEPERAVRLRLGELARRAVSRLAAVDA
jgi:8-oxo-dGTP diphosphatase